MTTTTDKDAEARRNAYNAAFHELGLGWFWDADCAMTDSGDERACLHAYLVQRQPHLLRAYDADFLVDLILAAKARCMQQTDAGSGRAAPDWRELQQRQIGV